MARITERSRWGLGGRRPNPSSAPIVRVIEVVDTREWIEGGDDKWYAIPGSGDQRACDRCGRTHEVHATVELADETTAVVGTGCMRGESMEVTKAMRSAERKAKKTRQGEFEHAKLQGLVDQYKAAVREVEGLQIPKEVTVEIRRMRDGPVMIFRMEDAEVWHQRDTISDYDKEERMRALVDRWRTLRLEERGIGYQHRMAAQKLRERNAPAPKAHGRLPNVTRGDLEYLQELVDSLIEDVEISGDDELETFLRELDEKLESSGVDELTPEEVGFLLDQFDGSTMWWRSDKQEQRIHAALRDKLPKKSAWGIPRRSNEAKEKGKKAPAWFEEEGAWADDYMIFREHDRYNLYRLDLNGTLVSVDTNLPSEWEARAAAQKDAIRRGVQSVIVFVVENRPKNKLKQIGSVGRSGNQGTSTRSKKRSKPKRSYKTRPGALDEDEEEDALEGSLRWANTARESDIMHEIGSYWVLRQPKGYTVFRSGPLHATSDSTYARTADGLSLAKARANYLARREEERTKPASNGSLANMKKRLLNAF